MGSSPSRTPRPSASGGDGKDSSAQATPPATVHSASMPVDGSGGVLEVLPSAKSTQSALALHEHLSVSMKPTLHAGDSYVINLDWRDEVEEHEFFGVHSEKSHLTHGGSANVAATSHSEWTMDSVDGRASSSSAHLPLVAGVGLRGSQSRTSNSHSQRVGSSLGFVRIKSTRQALGKGSGAGWSVSRKALEVLLVGEQAERVDPKDHRNHEQRLTERLARLNLDMLIMMGDGNCQFRSLSNELFGSQDKHYHVRQQAVDYLSQNRDIFQPFLGEDFDDYVDHMSRSGTWGDELTLRAACDSYRITVHVVTSDISNWYLTYAPSEGTSTREVFLTYIAPIHYNAIRRQSSLRVLGARARAAVGLSGSFTRKGGGLSLSGAPPTQLLGSPQAQQLRDQSHPDFLTAASAPGRL